MSARWNAKLPVWAALPLIGLAISLSWPHVSGALRAAEPEQSSAGSASAPASVEEAGISSAVPGARSSIELSPACPACDCCGHFHQGCLARYMSAVGGFNCTCRGSYKFPVPPQYTYHWPGLYSQQLMTAYNSPYRYPALKLPPWMSRGSQEPGISEPKPLTPSPAEGKPQLEPVH
ncbi:hypothetical protein [Thermogutta sp.]|uniref:hypothetical protein n=1 Tax=Thermogutta sp. TaxID=1962930 RepID=UPI003220210E